MLLFGAGEKNCCGVVDALDIMMSQGQAIPLALKRKMVDKDKIKEALDCMHRNTRINVHGFMSIECGETSRTCKFRYACMAFKRAVNRTDNTERGDSKRTVDRLEDEGITPFYHVQGSGKPMHLRKKRPGQNWAGVN